MDVLYKQLVDEFFQPGPAASEQQLKGFLKLKS